MIRLNTIYYILLVIFIWHVPSCNAWEIIPSYKPEQEVTDNTEATRSEIKSSFSFPARTFFNQRERLFAGAAADGTAKEFALSIFDFEENCFRPCAHEKVRLNGADKMPSPLYDKAIRLFTMVDENTMAFTLQSEPKKIFLCALPGCPEIITSDRIKDLEGNEIDSIEAIAGDQNHIFVAFKSKKSKGLGDEWAIATFVIHVEEKEIELTLQEFEELKSQVQQEQDEQVIENLSKELGATKDGKRVRKVTEKKLVQIHTVAITSAMRVSQNIQLMITHMHWCSNVKRLYIALKVLDQQENETADLLVAYLDQSALTLAPFSADRAYGKAISKVGSMLTTTLLDYIILLDNGDQLGIVYALPVVNFNGVKNDSINNSNAVHGALALDSQNTIQGFANNRAKLFVGRHFITPADSAQPFCTPKNKKSCVGTGALLAGVIDDIFIKDDAVYAIVNKARPGYSAGIYSSQAIFDARGAIAAWTPWQIRIELDDQVIADATIIPWQGIMVVACGPDREAIQVIKKTNWTRASNASDSLCALINEHFPKSRGGVQHIFEQGTFCIFLGAGKALLVDETNNCIAISDETIQSLGPLTAGSVLQNQSQNILILGGLKGVAIVDLADPHKKSKKLGDYAFVRKILVDESMIYILTDASFYRVDTSQSSLMDGNLAATLLADAKTLTQMPDYGIFLDCIVSKQCALIAHTAGLHRIGNAKDIRIDDRESLQWIPVAIPDSKDSVVSLLVVSTHEKECDWACGPSQLYVTSGSIGNNSSRVNRFAIEDFSEKNIDDTTITPLSDFVCKDHISSFANLGSFSALFATDGTLFLSACSQRKKKIRHPVVVQYFNKGKRVLPISLDDDATIHCIKRHRKTGKWMIGGDFGLIVNQ